MIAMPRRQRDGARADLFRASEHPLRATPDASTWPSSSDLAIALARPRAMPPGRLRSISASPVDLGFGPDASGFGCKAACWRNHARRTRSRSCPIDGVRPAVAVATIPPTVGAALAALRPSCGAGLLASRSRLEPIRSMEVAIHAECDRLAACRRSQRLPDRDSRHCSSRESDLSPAPQEASAWNDGKAADFTSLPLRPSG